MTGSRKHRPALAALVLGLAVGSAGCGQNSPVSPAGTTSDAAPDAVRLVFGPPGTAARSVATLGDGVTVRRIVKDGDDTILNIAVRNGRGRTDDLKLTLSIPEGAAPASEVITMTVAGSRLSLLSIAFSPAGLRFLQPALLKIDIGNDLVDLPLEGLVAHHVYADGTTVELEVLSVQLGRDSARILVAVDGFSRYSLSDGGPGA